MSRSTAEIVADLRFGIQGLEWTRQIEAADRLTELDATRPPCPTCGGKKFVTTETRDDDQGRGEVLIRTSSIRCPDCVDGKVSVEQLVATWRAVWSDEPMTIAPFGRNMGAIIDATLRRLREVRP